MNADPAGVGGLLAPSHTLAPGTLLRDYRIDKVLGEGGFGIVYLAYDAALERHVAIKEYLPSSMASRAGDSMTVVVKSAAYAETFALALRSFVNEARLLARFNHPSLVKVHQFWEEHGTAYMVMPYYEGPTLRAVLADLGRLPTEAEVCAWLLPLLDTLEVLHADQCFHRDIAPDNILITASGPLLLDFGAARRVIGDLTHALTAVLKPGYAPIEQYGDSPDMVQGPWTDIFALASVLYGAISGRRPVPSVERVIADRLRPLTQMAATRFRHSFLAAIDLAMALRPEHRPQSVAEFRTRLMADALPTSEPEAAAGGLPATRLAARAPLLPAEPPVPVAATPAPAPAPTRPNNLPRQRTSFVGRETELQDIKALLDESPLVTVLGMGGLGKTRLTLQAAAELLPRYPDGAWFVDLSVVTDPALVVGAVARTFDIFEEPGRPLLDTVCAWLKSRRLLVVLDNCEHVVAAAAEWVDAVLDGAPLVQVLASSREALDVPGEQSYPILPLPLPARDASSESVLLAPAVRMFVDRARAQQPRFSPEAEDPALLADLLMRLEGIPLAIELAAARLRSMSLAEIKSGLDDRYALLAGGSRLLQKRQQTLRALVDWSYDMLEPAEKQVFSQLAVFAGGFDLAAAQAVCADASVPAARMAGLLGSLVQKSLVAHDTAQAHSRYRLLETLRDYAADKLTEHDPQGTATASHCQHFFALAKEAARGMQGAEQGRWAQRLEDELDNLRAAAACAQAGGVDPLIAVKLAVALTGFWILRGHAAEGRKQVLAALDLPAVQASSQARAWALYTGAALASSQGDHETATRLLQTCLSLRREAGHAVEIAATLSTLSLARLQAGDAEGAATCETEALELFAEAADDRGQAISWLHLGQIRAWADDREAALDDLARAADLARAMGNREIEAESDLSTAEVCLRQQRFDAAKLAARHSLQVCKEAGDKRGEASATWCLGRLDLAGADMLRARASLKEALLSFQSHDMRAQLLGCLDDMAALMVLESAPAEALQLATAVDQSRQRLKLRRSPWEESRWQSQVAAMQNRLTPAAVEQAVKLGREWETDDAVRAALQTQALVTIRS
jgi:predicted ATPase/serine/threonine protein kinase